MRKYLSKCIWAFFAFSIAIYSSTPVLGLTESGEVAFERGLASFEQQKWAEALSYFDETIKTDPDYAPAHHYRGMTLLKLLQPEEAIKALAKAKSLDPNEREINLDLGTAYLEAGKLDLAIEAFEQELAINPTNANANYNLGYALLKKKKYGEALEPFSKARQLNPGLAIPARFYEGVALYNLKRYNEAREAFKEVLAMNPSAEVASASKRYLDAIEGAGEAPKRWGFVSSVLYQYDTNVVTANEDTDFPITIDGEEISDQEDSRILLTLYGRWNFLKTDNWSAEARYSFYQSFHFEVDEFNLQNHSPELELARRLNIGSKTGALMLNYRAGIALLGQDLNMYSVNHWVTPSFYMRLSSNFATMLSYRFNAEDFDEEDPDRDNLAHSGIVESIFSYRGLWDKPAVLRLAVGFDFEDAQDEAYDIRRPWVRLIAQNSFPLRINSRIMLYYENETHFNDDYDRVDDVFVGELALFKQLWGPVEANINFNYRMNNSTEKNFEYERTIVGGGFVVRF